MTIIIQTIPHKDQRYPTVGDWSYRAGFLVPGEVLDIKVSDLGNWKMEACIAIHELVEALLCKDRGIDQSVVDNWDMEVHPDSEDPGNEDGCPYQDEHNWGNEHEESLRNLLEITITDYEEALKKLNG